jgi:beta-glucosidase
VAYFNELQQLATRQTRLGIPLLQTEEGTHGLMCSLGTVFPEGPGLGSTWDLALIRDIYAAAAREARAAGIHQLCTLVVEPVRDPRLGRNQEAYSEDPFFCGRVAETIVRAVQGHDLKSPEHVVAVLCHYPGQSQPVSGPGAGRDGNLGANLAQCLPASLGSGDQESRGARGDGDVPRD